MKILSKLFHPKNEPEWLLDWRLKAFNQWKKMTEPDWSMLKHDPIDYQKISYYSAPKDKRKMLLKVLMRLIQNYSKLMIN